MEIGRFRAWWNRNIQGSQRNCGWTKVSILGRSYELSQWFWLIAAFVSKTFPTLAGCYSFQAIDVMICWCGPSSPGGCLLFLLLLLVKKLIYPDFQLGLYQGSFTWFHSDVILSSSKNERWDVMGKFHRSISNLLQVCVCVCVCVSLALRYPSILHVFGVCLVGADVETALWSALRLAERHGGNIQHTTLTYE